MKKVTLAALAVLLLAGCLKTNIPEIVDNTNNNKAPDYWLRFHNYDSGKLYYQTFFNIPGAGKVAGKYIVKNAAIQITIGNLEIIPAQWPEKLYAIIDFPRSGKPEDIVGIYDFPSPNNNISFKLYQAFAYDTLRRFLPDSGRLEIRYDTINKTISGEIKNFIYNNSAAEPDAVDVLNGKFTHFKLEE